MQLPGPAAPSTRREAGAAFGTEYRAPGFRFAAADHETRVETGQAMKLNPCDRDDSRLGYAISLLTAGTDCRCCIGARIVGALLVGITVGIGIGAELARWL